MGTFFPHTVSSIFRLSLTHTSHSTEVSPFLYWFFPFVTLAMVVGMSKKWKRGFLSQGENLSCGSGSACVCVWGGGGVCACLCVGELACGRFAYFFFNFVYTLPVYMPEPARTCRDCYFEVFAVLAVKLKCSTVSVILPFLFFFAVCTDPGTQCPPCSLLLFWLRSRNR